MDARSQFARTAADLVDTDDSVALVYAEISGQFFGAVERRHPDRVVNVGIREQLLVNVGAGLALTGLRPIVHTFGSFLVERAFEQVKLGFGHQDVGGVLVGAGGSFDIVGGGRTHQSPGDVALMDTLRGMRSCAPPWPAPGCTTCGWSPRRTPSRSRTRRAASTSYAAGPGPPSSRSGRCWTTSSRPPRDAT